MFAVFLLFPVIAKAEIYQGIAPLDTLGKIKEKFPSAIYESVNAAWVTENDAFYKITGTGISGKIYVKFDDLRPVFRKNLLENTDPKKIEIYEKLSQEENEDALSVNWVRWMPEQPIPLQRFIQKYGNPSKSAFDDQDLTPYKSWVNRGISAYLSNNEKYVLRVDYSFTVAEQRIAWKTKHNFIPKWLESTKNIKK